MMDYDAIAPYYDLIHAELTEDVGFVLTLAGRTPGPVLELGCGTGRLLLPLARAGHRVLGLDNNPAMLDRARDRLAELPAEIAAGVSLREGDLREPDLTESPGLIVIAYNTWLHLPHAAMGPTLRRLRRLLRHDGRLFIDLPNPFLLAATPNDHLLTLERTFRDPRDDALIQQLASSSVDDQRQILHITWLFDRLPTNGGPLHRTVIEADYHYLYPHEAALLLHDTGFRLEAQFGGYGEAPFTEESDRLLIVATPAP